MDEEKQEFWLLPVVFAIKKKDALNAFELFQETVMRSLMDGIGHREDINFLFELESMEHHTHTSNKCKTEKISKEDVELIQKLTLPLEVLKQLEASKRKFAEAEAEPCPICNGKGKIKEGSLPAIEIRPCEKCKGIGRSLTQDENHAD